MCNINRMATKKEFEEKREYARLLFMQGETQKVIAEKVGVSAVTINKWVAENGWQEQRAAANITRPELVNKLLHTIDKLIEQVNESDDPEAMAGLGDKLAKLSTTIERLDKKSLYRGRDRGVHGFQQVDAVPHVVRRRDYARTA